MSIEEISYMVGHIICNPFSKHRRYKFPVNFLCVEIFIFTVEKRRCCIRTYQVSERFSNHCKTENWAILQKIIDKKNTKKYNYAGIVYISLIAELHKCIQQTFWYAASKNSMGLVPKLIACPRKGIVDGMCGGTGPF